MPTPAHVLLIHGFTATPQTLAPLTQGLAERGHRVHAPLLPGHGTTWQDLEQTTWRQWFAAVSAALDDARRASQPVSVVGISLGGALALRLAQERPRDVNKLVLINPAVVLDLNPLERLGLRQRLVRSVKAVGGDIRKPDAREVSYERTPAASVRQIEMLLDEVRRDIAQVACPVLLFSSLVDHVLPTGALNGLCAHLRAPLARVHLAGSYHVATLDYDAPAIVHATDVFLRTQGGLS